MRKVTDTANKLRVLLQEQTGLKALHTRFRQLASKKIKQKLDCKSLILRLQILEMGQVLTKSERNLNIRQTEYKLTRMKKKYFNLLCEKNKVEKILDKIKKISQGLHPTTSKRVTSCHRFLREEQSQSIDCARQQLLSYFNCNKYTRRPYSKKAIRWERL